MAFENVAHVQHSLEELQEHNVLDGLKVAVVYIGSRGDISLPGIKTTSKIISTIDHAEGSLWFSDESVQGPPSGSWVTIVADDTISCDPSCYLHTLVIFYYNPVVPD